MKANDDLTMADPYTQALRNVSLRSLANTARGGQPQTANRTAAGQITPAKNITYDTTGGPAMTPPVPQGAYGAGAELGGAISRAARGVGSTLAGAATNRMLEANQNLRAPVVNYLAGLFGAQPTESFGARMAGDTYTGKATPAAAPVQAPQPTGYDQGGNTPTGPLADRAAPPQAAAMPQATPMPQAADRTVTPTAINLPGPLAGDEGKLAQVKAEYNAMQAQDRQDRQMALDARAKAMADNILAAQAQRTKADAQESYYSHPGADRRGALVSRLKSKAADEMMERATNSLGQPGPQRNYITEQNAMQQGVDQTLAAQQGLRQSNAMFPLQQRAGQLAVEQTAAMNPLAVQKAYGELAAQGQGLELGKIGLAQHATQSQMLDDIRNAKTPEERQQATNAYYAATGKEPPKGQLVHVEGETYFDPAMPTTPLKRGGAAVYAPPYGGAPQVIQTGQPQPPTKPPKDQAIAQAKAAMANATPEQKAAIKARMEAWGYPL